MSDLPIRIDDGSGDIWPPDNYTGEWAFHWPNGQMKYHAWYVNGKREGEVICYWEDGSIFQEGVCVDGECRGIWTDYRFGDRFKETDYADGDNFVVRFFDFDGSVMLTKVWKNGKVVDERDGP